VAACDFVNEGGLDAVGDDDQIGLHSASVFEGDCPGFDVEIMNVVTELDMDAFMLG